MDRNGDRSERPMIERILRAAEGAPLLDVLGERLSPTDLQSLLLEVFTRRASGVDAQGLARRFHANRFVRPSAVPQRVQLELDRLAYSVIPSAFVDLELSPLTALGTCSALATVHPDKSIATIRNSEVCSDPTNVLALEAAARRRDLLVRERGSRALVRLCTSQRVVRPEQPGVPNAWAHFRLFALVTAGRASDAFGFEAEALSEHVRFHVGLLSRARDAGFRIRSIEVLLTNLAGPELQEVLEDRVAADLRAAWPGLEVRSAPERTQGRGYYRAACFMVNAVGEDGETYFLADGGATDWTEQLLGDRKERLFISGVGSERLCACLAP